MILSSALKTRVQNGKVTHVYPDILGTDEVSYCNSNNKQINFSYILRELSSRKVNCVILFYKALLFDPKNRELLQLNKQLDEKIHLHDQATAKAMGKMFQN